MPKDWSEFEQEPAVISQSGELDNSRIISSGEGREYGVSSTQQDVRRAADLGRYDGIERSTV